MIMDEYFYNFTIEDDNLGFSYLKIEQNTLHSFTHFKLPNGEVINNLFKLSFEGTRVLECNHNDLPPVDMSALPDDHYPGCAYPIFLKKINRGNYSYTQVSEGNASIIGEYEILRDESDLVEFNANQESRRFTFDENNIISKISWSGAISHLCSDASESVKGSSVKFSKSPY
jgi:hypothetical protein